MFFACCCLCCGGCGRGLLLLLLSLVLLFLVSASQFQVSITSHRIERCFCFVSNGRIVGGRWGPQSGKRGNVEMISLFLESPSGSGYYSPPAKLPFPVSRFHYLTILTILTISAISVTSTSCSRANPSQVNRANYSQLQTKPQQQSSLPEFYL